MTLRYLDVYLYVSQAYHLWVEKLTVSNPNAGKWASTCSQRPSSKCSSSNVFWSKHGYGYDEEKSVDDYTSGKQLIWYASWTDVCLYLKLSVYVQTLTFAWVNFFFSGFVAGLLFSLIPSIYTKELLFFVFDILSYLVAFSLFYALVVYLMLIAEMISPYSLSVFEWVHMIYLLSLIWCVTCIYSTKKKKLSLVLYYWWCADVFIDHLC